MTGQKGRWYCGRCGRLLAVVTAGAGAASRIVIVCKRCKLSNCLDLQRLKPAPDAPTRNRMVKPGDCLT